VLKKHSQWVTMFDDPPDDRLRINAEAAVRLGRDKTQARWGPQVVDQLSWKVGIGNPGSIVPGWELGLRQVFVIAKASQILEL
jgi:hypothetical protein